MSEESLTHRFIEGLPSQLRAQAWVISGGYDEVVAKTSLVSQAISKAGPEQVRKVGERDFTKKPEPDGAGNCRHEERRCYICRKPGHLAKDCYQIKGQGAPNNKNN